MVRKGNNAGLYVYKGKGHRGLAVLSDEFFCEFIT